VQREGVGENEGRVSRRGFEQTANGQRKRALGGFLTNSTSARLHNM
jgi:hypothetical protein